MVITAHRLELLQTTLAGHRVLPYSDTLTVSCFDFGISLAQAETDLPDWLDTAPQWARATVVIGRSATLRAIQEDRLLTPTPAVLSPVVDAKPEQPVGILPSTALTAVVDRVSTWCWRLSHSAAQGI